MSSKKNVLAIFPQLPLPQFAGDRQKVNNLIKILSKSYNLNIVIIARTKHTQQDEDFVKQHSVKYKFFYLSKVSILLSLIKGVFKGESLQVAFFYNATINNYIKQEHKNADFLFCNLIRVAKYIQPLNKPKFIDIVDSLSINYKRSLENVHSLLWKGIYKYEYTRLHKYEEKIMQEFDASFLVNYNEQQFWQNKINHKPIVWLPQGIKEELFAYTSTDAQYSNSIMFIGKMDYQPNIDAVLWFLQNVWQHISQKIDFYIVGVNPPQKIVNQYKTDSRIKFMGYVKDPYLIMKSCLAVVSTMQTGGGVQNKILEAMAMQKINIATSLGASSIRFGENGKNILVVDEPKEIAKAIDDIVLQPQKFSTIAVNGAKMVGKVYTWENFENELIKQINTSLCKH